MGKTIEVCINGEWKEAFVFQEGQRVKNEYGDFGTVKYIEGNDFFVHVDWDEKDKSGKVWMATSLNLLE